MSTAAWVRGQCLHLCRCCSSIRSALGCLAGRCFFFSNRRRHTKSDRDWSSFFFSSRRRHTRSDRDWSSDVCSSDRSEEHTSELQSQAEDAIRDLIVTGVQTCALPIDRKSPRLNSSHDQISYAVFCLRSEERRVGKECR